MLTKNIHVGNFYYTVTNKKTGMVAVVEVLEKLPNREGWRVYNTLTKRKTRIRRAGQFQDLAENPNTSKNGKVQKRIECTRPQEDEPKKTKLSSRLKDRMKGARTRPDQPKYAFPPTDEQQAILDMATEAERSSCRVIVVGAGAGTGKTATDVMLAQTLQGNGQYTAFNTNLVNEGKPKFASTRCACNTTHSLAFRSVGKTYSHRLNGNRVKSSQIARMLGIREDFEIPLSGEVKKITPKVQAALVMGAVKKFCQSAERRVETKHFRYVDGIDEPEASGRKTYDNNNSLRDHLLPYARKAWKDIANTEGQLPFAHDHYVKIWQLGDPVISADYILLDEAQDTAPVMLDILAQQIKPTRKVKPLIILVGDSAQQIYEWRGAVDALAAFPDAPRRYLSQSFRFGVAIAEVANLILSELREPTELRLKGLETIPSRVVSNHPIDNPTCILCRTNAMAISMLLNAIAEGKRPFLVGGGRDTVSFVRAALDLQEGRTTDHPDLSCFADWAEVQDYAQLEEGEDLKLMVKLIDEFQPKVILDALAGMVREGESDLVISTAHKSKGRQWSSVKLAPDFPTRPKTYDPELKLLYVACTRAQHVLDVSECPFFQGEGGMDTLRIEVKQPSAEDTDNFIRAIESEPKTREAVQPSVEQQSTSTEKPSDPIRNDRFTWSRLQEGGWGVRGPKGHKGQTVTVERKDGSTSEAALQESVWEDDDVSLYRV